MKLKFPQRNAWDKPSQQREKAKAIARGDAMYESALERASLRRRTRGQKPRAKPSIFQ